MQIFSLSFLGALLLYYGASFGMHEMHQVPNKSSKKSQKETSGKATSKKEIPLNHSKHIDEKNKQNSAHQKQTMHQDKSTWQSITDPISPWSNPKIKPSPPPKLMGKQMGVVNTIGIPPLGYEMDGNVKVFRIIAQPVEKIMVDETKPADYEHLIPEKNKLSNTHHHHPVVQKIKAWGYNGTTPGPTIEANEGDRIRVILKNELPEPTSIHWHGIELPNDQDGATPETNKPVLPGETFSYEFTLYQSGTFMYHSGFNVMKQDDFGLHGMLVIHPKEYAKKIDHDIAIFLQQWKIPPGNEYPDLTGMEFNWFTFNGYAAPSIPMIEVHQNDRVRIRFANVIMMTHPIHMHGHTWWVVGTEGGPIPDSAQWPGNTISVAPGTTRDVEFVAWNPGLWRIHCHKLHHIMNAHGDIPLPIMAHGGMFTILHVIPDDPKAPWKHPKQDENKSITKTNLLQDQELPLKEKTISIPMKDADHAHH